MTHLVFVYGTLKAGFPNQHVMAGRRVPGLFVTAQRLALYIVGDDHVPWLVDEGGHGEYVEGEVYEVEASNMSALDRLEAIGQPGGYLRVPIEVRHVAEESPGRTLAAEVYLQQMRHLNGRTIHHGPLRIYTAEYAARYRHE